MQNLSAKPSRKSWKIARLFTNSQQQKASSTHFCDVDESSFPLTCRTQLCLTFPTQIVLSVRGTQTLVRRPEPQHQKRKYVTWNWHFSKRNNLIQQPLLSNEVCRTSCIRILVFVLNHYALKLDSFYEKWMIIRCAAYRSNPYFVSTKVRMLLFFLIGQLTENTIDWSSFV